MTGNRREPAPRGPLPQLPRDRPQTPTTHTHKVTSLPCGKAAWDYVAVVIPSSRAPGETDGPELGILLGERPGVIWWGPDYPPAPLPAGHRVVKRYAVDASDPSTADWQRARLQFARDFPPRAVEPHPAPAWIAPDGRFYACRWLEHDRLAYRLAAAHYGDPRGPLALEERSWLRVQRDGTIVRLPSARHPNQPQLDVLFALAQVSDGLYSDNICNELELACVLARLDV